MSTDMDLKALAATCIGKLTAAGADVAQVTLSFAEKKEFNVDGGEFSLFRTLFNAGLSMVAIKGGRQGTITVNRFDEEAVDRAVADCMAVTESADPDPAWEIAPFIGERTFVKGCPEPELDLFFSRTQELLAEIGKRFPKVMMEQMITSHTKADSVYMDTSGNCYKSLSGFYDVDLMFSAHEGTKSSSFFGCGYRTAVLDRPLLSYGNVERSLADIEKQIDTVSPSGKFTGTVVFTPDCLGEMMGTAVGLFASGGSLLDGTSLWKDALGTQVADARLTLSYAPHHPGIVSGQDYTGDGYIAEDFDLIRDGVLQSFFLSQYIANKTGHARSANLAGGNMVIAAGDRTLDELIAGIDRGLLVGRFSGGSPASNGDFSGVAKNSFWIENGRITDAASEVMISGNLADMLHHLVGITRERVSDGMSLLPYAAFDGITVAGK